MHLTRLELTNVRSFRRLDLRLGPGAHVIVGDNAQGKTNLLEAVALLATGRTSRAGTDGDLIAWGSLHDDPLPAARLVGALSRRDGDASVEITVMSTQPLPEAPAGASVAVPRTSRRFRVNGVARRASDLIGVLRVVMFAAQDLRLIDGPPAGRRRYLDITVSQLDREYVRAAQRYARVLQQRNSLLRRIQEPRGQLECHLHEIGVPAHRSDGGSGVHVTLHEVAAEPVGGFQRPFQIDTVPRPDGPEGCSPASLTAQLGLEPVPAP